jgi:hypothetical protein
MTKPTQRMTKRIIENDDINKIVDDFVVLSRSKDNNILEPCYTSEVEVRAQILFARLSKGNN